MTEIGGTSVARRNPVAAQTRSTLTRYLFEGLLAFVALNAFAGGYYGLSGAKGIPREWLTGRPFASYFIPGLFLLVVIGGAAVEVLAELASTGKALELGIADPTRFDRGQRVQVNLDLLSGQNVLAGEFPAASSLGLASTVARDSAPS